MLSAQKLPILGRMMRHRLRGQRAACPYSGGMRLRRVVRKRLVSLESVPQPFKRWWAQGLELVACREAAHGMRRGC